MSAIAIGNDLIHYEVLGRGKPVILIHGWLGSWRYWLPTMQLLSAQFRVYALDMCGFGESQHNPTRYSLMNQSKLVEQFMEKQGIAKAAIIGHSMGAAIAVELARRRPDLVPRMGVISLPMLNVNVDELPRPSAPVAPRPAPPTTAHLDETVPHNPFRAADPARRAQLQAAAMAAGSAFQTPTLPIVSSASAPARPTQPNPMADLVGESSVIALLERAVPRRDPMFAGLLSEVEKTDKAAVDESIRTFMTLNSAATLCQLPMPVLLMHGRDDTFIPPPTDEVLSRITAAKATGPLIAIVASPYRHFPMIDSVSKFGRLMVDFLDTDLTNNQTNIQLKETWSRQLR